MRIIDDVRVDKSGDCWIWTGTLSGKGYGRIGKRINGKMTLFAVHRLSYAQEIGPIPMGLNVCHRCDVRKCVRPERLWLGSQQQNVDDMMQKGRKVNRGHNQTHCKHGHPLDKLRTSSGKRYCSECKRISSAKRQGSSLERQRGPYKNYSGRSK